MPREYRGTFEIVARGESAPRDQRRSENLAFPAIRHARFPPRARPSSRRESRLVTIHISLRAVPCAAAYENPPSSHHRRNREERDPRRVLRLALRCIVHMQVRGVGGPGEIEAVCSEAPPRRVNGATLEDGSFAICPPGRGAISKCPSGAISSRYPGSKTHIFSPLSRTRRRRRRKPTEFIPAAPRRWLGRPSLS